MSGVNTTYYSINSEPWVIYEEPLVLTEDSLYNIVYFSVDTAGNMEFPKLAHVKVDQTSPFINLTYKILYGNPIQGWVFLFTVIAVDHMSGMDRVEFFHNEGFQLVVTGPGPFYNYSFIYCGCPIHEIRADGYDVAGNMVSDIIKNPTVSKISIQQSIHPLFLQFLERFPLLNKILSSIQGRK
jgi:hypothetical protein